MGTLVFKNASIVLPKEVIRGSVSVVNGRIAAIDQGLSNNVTGIDLQGDYLLPGFIEIHTDNFERHLMPRPKVNWAELPALLAHDAEIAAAGITTVFDALGVGDGDPDSLRGSTWDSVLSTLDMCVREHLLRADHHIHVRCELPAPNTADLFQPFQNHPRLSLISLMDHTPGQRQWENVEVARVYYTGKKGWSNEKFDKQVNLAAELQAKYAAPHREFFVEYCKSHHIPLASHDDTTEAHVHQAHAEGATIAEFPTTLKAAQCAHQLGMLNVMGGPNVVRGGSHSGNVAALDLARHGILDILSSDYVPSSLLSAVMRLVDDEILSLPQAIATVSQAPALATGLNDRGQIASGMRGDLIHASFINLSNQKRHAVVKAVWREGNRIL
ncbi:MAG: alpha-D-ribose 1-methylphosphonate 5-triphosphate diphosphatase [Betaproteobacteria bacterium]|nr:alpha-D-ribose 1-methylphosphonate 5-triphosphate diphosphatase [Betaproteobacteria bacterium]